MRIAALGENAWILRELPFTPALVAAAIERAALPGVTDVVPCAETVGVYYESQPEPAALASAVESATDLRLDSRVHLIPVCYDLGTDWEFVCSALGLSRPEIVRLHSEAEYECFAIGFCPGFAYLGELPMRLRGVPRLSSPRTRTEPGSLGITGHQTAVYPLTRPGGWPLIGKTPYLLVDEQTDYFPISVGDRVRFEPIARSAYPDLEGRRL